MKIIASAVLGLLAWAIFSATPASATDLNLLGGPGGSYERIECPVGSYMVGLDGMVGIWNDRLSPLCSEFDTQLQRFRGGANRQRWAGTSGGGNFEHGPCSNNEIVKRLTTGATRNDDNNPAFTQETGLGCVSYLAPDRLHASVTLNGSAASYFLWSESCPPGEVATGVAVRDGTFVDAIGLICGPPPQPHFVGSGPDPRNAEPAAKAGTHAKDISHLLHPH